MEIMGYRAPPEPLLPVFEALCLLFDRPTTLVHVHVYVHFICFPFSWSDCQQLMLSQHFFESLRFFDKDNVPQSKLDKLEKLLNDEQKLSIQRITEVNSLILIVRYHTVLSRSVKRLCLWYCGLQHWLTIERLKERCNLIKMS